MAPKPPFRTMSNQKTLRFFFSKFSLSYEKNCFEINQEILKHILYSLQIQDLVFIKLTHCPSSFNGIALKNYLDRSIKQTKVWNPHWEISAIELYFLNLYSLHTGMMMMFSMRNIFDVLTQSSHSLSKSILIRDNQFPI